MHPTRALLFMVLIAGCTADQGGPPSVAFVSPSPGASFTRDRLGGNGALVASVPVELDIGGSADRIIVTSGQRELGDASDGSLSAEVRSGGKQTLVAKAVASDGTELASATVDIDVADPQVADCHAWLDLYKLDYTLGPSNQGVDDPITVQAPINGVAYRYSEDSSDRKTLMGDCTLIKSLAEAAPYMRDHDIATLVDLGVYNYRCIDQSKTPPNCSMSQHAYAKAIDIASWITHAGDAYTVLTDWDVDPATTTCTAETTPGKDAFLHTVICELKHAGVWNIVLTPNYNADHRNHFHVDLTEGADTIK